jgi:integrase
MSEHHELMGGKLHLYKRPNSTLWQASTYLAGRNHRISTKQEGLARATEIAEDWYIELRGKAKVGLLHSGPTFKKAADQFLQEYETITQGQRSPEWVQHYHDMLRVHLVPFFGKMALSEITPGKLQAYRIHRRQTAMERIKRPPSRSSIHHEMVAIRQVLKTALRHGWLAALPDMSTPYKTSGKITHRAWFSPEEYKKLYEATRRRANHSLHNRGRWKWECEQLHDYVLFMANTGLRPDEVRRLEFRDVQIVKEHGIKDPLLHIEVRGKRGVGFCKSTAEAVHPYRRLKERLRKPPKGGTDGEGRLRKPVETELLFPGSVRRFLNTILAEEGLKRDRDGNVRTAYSLRHTYICFRLMEGADIYQIAKNCRTSVEMIEKFYAAHIKTTLDASAINVRKGTIARERRNTVLA